jgi:hypothetical protein
MAFRWWRQYFHQPWEHGDHPPDLTDEDDAFLDKLKRAQS